MVDAVVWKTTGETRIGSSPIWCKFIMQQNNQLNIKSKTISISALLTANKRYIIPRYQREYSWTKKEASCLLNDLISNIKKHGVGKNPYFLGIILLDGKFSNQTCYTLKIIDGQQRLTTITILLHCLWELLKDKNSDVSKKIDSMIFNNHDDHKNDKIFDTEAKTKLFPFWIQDKNDVGINPTTEEEYSIKDVLDTIRFKLSEKELKQSFKGFKDEKFTYDEQLISIFKELSTSFVILAWNNKGVTSPKIFESLNAKGLPLKPSDNIKNLIFTYDDDVNPNDVAAFYWKQIHENLSFNGEFINFNNFLRQYWSSRYHRTTVKQLYKQFSNQINSKDICREILADINSFSECYGLISWPSTDRIGTKNDLKKVVQHLKYIKSFRLTLPRGFITVCYEKYKANILGSSDLRKIYEFIEMYHFIYSMVMSLRTNQLDLKYCEFAIQISRCDDRASIINLLKEFSKELVKLLPEKKTIFESLLKLKTSKKNNNLSSISCTYYINKIENILSKNKIDKNGSSVEHIFNQSNGENYLYIWNLLLLEESINSTIPTKAMPNDKIEAYKSSSYSMPKYLLEHVDFFVSCEETVNKLKEFLEKTFELFFNYLLKIY